MMGKMFIKMNNSMITRLIFVTSYEEYFDGYILKSYGLVHKIFHNSSNEFMEFPVSDETILSFKGVLYNFNIVYEDREFIIKEVTRDLKDRPHKYEIVPLTNEGEIPPEVYL